VLSKSAHRDDISSDRTELRRPHASGVNPTLYRVQNFTRSNMTALPEIHLLIYAVLIILGMIYHSAGCRAILPDLPSAGHSTHHALLAP
jgi:hypothetical protein